MFEESAVTPIFFSKCPNKYFNSQLKQGDFARSDVIHRTYLFSTNASVNKLSTGAGDTADLPCLLKVTNGTASKAGVDLHAIRDNGSCDKFVSRDILRQEVVGLLVKNDGLLGVLLHLGLGPLLLKKS